MRIVILYGGTGDERPVSLASGAHVAEALIARGHDLLMYDWRGEALPDFLQLRMREADAVFLTLHGGAGEDGTLQKALERGGIFHYTGAGPTAAAHAMDKGAAKDIVSAAGVPVARGAILRHAGETLPADLPLPCVIKPLCGGSSVGMLLYSGGPLPADTVYPLLAEAYLPGREFSVGVLGDKVLPPVEIRPQGGPYDYAHKYTAGAALELCPAPLSADETRRLVELTAAAFSALGLRDVGRVDFRADGAGAPVFLEANSLPGMTATSLLPLAAAAAGIPFFLLCERLCLMAAARKRA